MAKWVKIKRNYDYMHESRAVTAFKKDHVVYVPKHMLENMPADAYEETDKPESPDESDGRVFLTDG